MNDNLCSSVLTFKLDHNSDSFPFTTLLNDILADFLGILRINYMITRPSGPNLGARVAAGPGYPPNTLMLTKLL